MISTDWKVVLVSGMVLASVTILGVTHVLDGSVVGTLISAIVAYFFGYLTPRRDGQFHRISDQEAITRRDLPLVRNNTKKWD